MHREGKTRRSLILADGYSYTEIIPAPDTDGTDPKEGFIAIFHAMFCPNDADHEATAEPSDMAPLLAPDKA
ncbi:hypothetical protein N8H22_09850 [Stutzerimonas stutzeri]|uniref:hypothetical protein n=1 Tax=Stutzerimonas sp. S1 TaxID=3030652 RepID=UPI002224DE96|nr:hypothetical protein [Stutzerimonas sp. S1]MCW3148894.1 hypothetical protein [Stutzerimonas sp. S1]